MHDGVHVHEGRWTPEPADVVISHLGDSNAGAKLAKQWGVPSVRMVQGYVSDPRRQLNRLPTALAVFASEAVQKASKWDGASIVVHPPIDREAYATTPGDRVTIINTSPAKGGNLFRTLAVKMPDTEFLAVKGGWGSQRSVDFPNVESLPTTNDVRGDVYARTRLLLVPSQIESYCRVAVEAACSGIPVIAHPSAGLREAMGDGAIWLNRNKSSDWIDALRRLEDPDEWAAASERSLRVAEKLDPDHDRERFADAIDQLVGQDRVRVRDAAPVAAVVPAPAPRVRRGTSEIVAPTPPATGVKVVVLVPRRDDGGRRDQLWEYVRARWAREHPTWTVIEGHHETGPFNRSAAINEAASRARPSWEVAVIADSDSFVGPDQIDTAVEGCRENGQMWLAYDRYCYLTRAMSDKIMGGFNGMWEDGVEFTMTGNCSSMVVVRRDVWNEARGFDERFIGWGWEDLAASHAFQTFGDGLCRVPGPVWHLHHPTSVNAGRDEHRDAKAELAERYARAAYDKTAMRALIDERQ